VGRGDLPRPRRARGAALREAVAANAIDVRGYADFAPLGHSVRVQRDEKKGTIAWKIKFRDGTEKNFLSPITTKPWGTAIPKLAEVPGPSKEMRDSQLLYNEPKWIRMDEGGLRTLEDLGHHTVSFSLLDSTLSIWVRDQV
jgi:adenylylsulfate reductase subunit B